MSVFALNFKFDLQESGGEATWKGLERAKTPNLGARKKTKAREKQMERLVQG